MCTWHVLQQYLVRITNTFEICDAFEGRFSVVLVPRFHRRRNGALRTVRRSLGSPERVPRASHVECIYPCNARHTANSSSVSLPARLTRRAGGGGRQQGIMTRRGPGTGGHFNTASRKHRTDCRTSSAVERPAHAHLYSTIIFGTRRSPGRKTERMNPRYSSTSGRCRLLWRAIRV